MGTTQEAQLPRSIHRQYRRCRLSIVRATLRGKDYSCVISTGCLSFAAVQHGPSSLGSGIVVIPPSGLGNSCADVADWDGSWNPALLKCSCAGGSARPWGESTARCPAVAARGEWSRRCLTAGRTCYYCAPFAPVAQLDRAPVYGTGGRRFESCWARGFSKVPSLDGAFVVLCRPPRPARPAGFMRSTSSR